MNLIIDIGNTRAKLAVFQNNKIIDSTICDKKDIFLVQQKFLSQYPKIDHGIIANVTAPHKTHENLLVKLSGTRINLSAATPIPFHNYYESPKTLGIDRIALAAAAVTNCPEKNVLVIDAGTCVTYDIITAKKNYRGGAISPGLNMRFRALNNFTANLPLLTPSPKKNDQNIGQNTVESLHLGVRQGLTYEMDGFITGFQEIYSDLTVILTGGDSEILSKSLKNSIFVAENFLLTGLNCILEYNKH